MASPGSLVKETQAGTRAGPAGTAVCRVGQREVYMFWTGDEMMLGDHRESP